MMKRIRAQSIICFFVFLLSAFSPTCFGSRNDEADREMTASTRQLASLAEKWNISGPVFNYSSLEFSLTYQVSDFVLEGMIAEEIFDENCAEGGNAVNAQILSAQVIPDSSVPPGAGDAPKNVQVQITLNPEAISQSSIYSEEVVDNQMIATVRFCHRFMLFTLSATPIEVNFRETIVTLTIDLTDGFQIASLNVADKDKLVRTANQAYGVEGFQCDSTNQPLSELELATSRNQGSIIRVCVRPDEEARQDGVYMRSVDSFVFERNYGGSIGSVTQMAIENGGPASNMLTILDCTSGDEVCVFETILMAIFFRLPGSVDGTGIASMQFGRTNLDAPRKLLRRLQNGDKNEKQDGVVAGVAGVAEFDLSMELIPRDRPRSSSGAKSRSTSWPLQIIVSFLTLLLSLSLTCY